MSVVRFDCTALEREQARLIAGRARVIALKALGPSRARSVIDFQMDIVACHMNGCRLKLAELLEASDFIIAHDVFGIGYHIDRSTGKLCKEFWPRLAEAVLEDPEANLAGAVGNKWPAPTEAAS